MACRYPVYNGGFCIKCHAKKSATAGRFSGFARRLSGFWLNFHSNRGKIYMWNRLLFGSRLHGGFIRDSGQPVGTDLYIAVAWQFYTDLSRLPCRDPPPRNRRRVLCRNFKIQAIQGCFSDFSSPPLSARRKPIHNTPFRPVQEGAVLCMWQAQKSPL